MRIGSLCTGYDGLALGIQQVIGGRVVWTSDIDKGACKVIAHRYPDAPNLGDLTVIDWAELDRTDPIDVLCAGYPCQPFSHAGRRKGTDDERHLWPYIREAIRHLRPRLTLLENVAGHRSLGFDRVLGDLAENGMHVQWTSIRASDVGAPHRRERLFIAVTPDTDQQGRGGFGRLKSIGRDTDRRDRADGPWSTGEPAALLPTPVADNSRGLPSSGTDYQSLPNAVCALLPTPAVNDMGEGKTVEAWDEWTAKMQAKHGNGNGHGASLAIEAQRTRIIADSRAPGAQRLDPGSNTTLTDWGQYADAIHRWEQITRPAPPPTETGPKGSPRLSARFSEWLMGVPAGHITDVPGITRNEALKLAGNGVVPQQAAAALRLMLARALPQPVPTCRMAEDPDWPGKPRVCPHTVVVESGGTCADELCDCRGDASHVCPPCRERVYG